MIGAVSSAHVHPRAVDALLGRLRIGTQVSDYSLNTAFSRDATRCLNWQQYGTVAP